MLFPCSGVTYLELLIQESFATCPQMRTLSCGAGFPSICPRFHGEGSLHAGLGMAGHRTQEVEGARILRGKLRGRCLSRLNRSRGGVIAARIQRPVVGRLALAGKEDGHVLPLIDRDVRNREFEIRSDFPDRHRADGRGGDIVVVCSYRPSWLNGSPRRRPVPSGLRPLPCALYSALCSVTAGPSGLPAAR